MYEHMGDALALQYGGSQMHRQMKKDRAKTATLAPVLYRQKAPNRSKEVFVSIMRHYQNSFQDTGKQDAINLFLGYYIPWDNITKNNDEIIHIWDMESDYYLHNALMKDYKTTLGQICFADKHWYMDHIHAYEHSLLLTKEEKEKHLQLIEQYWQKQSSVYEEIEVEKEQNELIHKQVDKEQNELIHEEIEVEKEQNELTNKEIEVEKEEDD